jgi:hypothetical protein
MTKTMKQGAIDVTVSPHDGSAKARCVIIS